MGGHHPLQFFYTDARCFGGRTVIYLVVAEFHSRSFAFGKWRREDCPKAATR
jgi:hypothetical protein